MHLLGKHSRPWETIPGRRERLSPRCQNNLSAVCDYDRNNYNFAVSAGHFEASVGKALKAIPQNRKGAEGQLRSEPLMFLSLRMSPRACWPPSP